MSDFVILIVGCGVMGIVISSAFIGLLATDRPNESPPD